MFERFTERARLVLADAGAVARELRSPAIRRHHLLVALLDAANDGSRSVAAVLDDAGVDPGEFRGALVESLKASETPLPESGTKAPFTAEAKKALELSLREALSLGHNYIGREHLLLGVLRDLGDGPLAETVGATQLAYRRAREVVAQESPPTRVARQRRMRGREFRAFSRRQSYGLETVLRRAYGLAGDQRDVTTGDVLVALVDTPGTHFATMLGDVTLPTSEELRAELARLIDSGATDTVEGGGVNVDESGAVTFRDPRVAEAVKRLARDGAMTNEQLIEVLRHLQD